MDANDWFNNSEPGAAPVRQQQRVGSLHRRTDQEGQAVLLRRTTKAFATSCLPPRPVFAPTPAFMSATLNNLATGTYNAAFGLGADPAALPVYTQYFNLFSNAPGYNGNNIQTSGCIDSNSGVSLGPGTASIPGLGVPGLTNDNCISSIRARLPCPEPSSLSPDASTTTCPTKTTSCGAFASTRARRPPTPIPSTRRSDAASYQPSYDGQGQWSHVFSPNATNQFVYAGSYYRAIFTQNNTSIFPYAVDGTAFGFNLLPSPETPTPSPRDVTSPSISSSTTSP